MCVRPALQFPLLPKKDFSHILQRQALVHGATQNTEIQLLAQLLGLLNVLSLSYKKNTPNGNKMQPVYKKKGRLFFRPFRAEGGT